MTREEAIQVLRDWDGYFIGHGSDDVNEALNMAIEELKKKSCEDCISREAVIKLLKKEDWADTVYGVMNLPSVIPQPKTGHCKDCKWWKDSDGAYRRGIEAESQCPMNRKEVYEGNGYCFLFKPRESENKE